MYSLRNAILALPILSLTPLLAPGQEKAAARLSPPPVAGKVVSYTYRQAKDATLAATIHFPAEWKETDRRPAIVFFFGGGWTNGSIKQFEPHAEYFAGRGLVTIRADYRVKSRHDVTPADCVFDAQGAMRWVRRNAAGLGIDAERIVASGGSAGGHLAACTPGPVLKAVGEDPGSCKPSALLLFNPVLKFEGVTPLMERLGRDEGFAHAISPTLHLTKQSPPALLFYGKEDKLLAQGEEYIAHAKKVGVRAELFLADGVGHGFFNRSPWRERTLERADVFLQSLGYLTGKATIK
jgi:acetyl esterase/lipase